MGSVLSAILTSFLTSGIGKNFQREKDSSTVKKSRQNRRGATGGWGKPHLRGQLPPLAHLNAAPDD